MKKEFSILLIVIFTNLREANLNNVNNKQFHKFSKNHICNICTCRIYESIKCFHEKRNEHFIESIKTLVLNSSNFEYFNQELKDLIIDFDYLSLNIKINHFTFSKMKNLRLIFLNNIYLELIKLPNLDSALNLEELTIQNSNLKQIDNQFCLSKKYLQKIELSNNDLEDLKFIFDKCSSLTLLDLSYNRIKSLTEMFNQRSSLIFLLLDNNQIEEIDQFDLINLTDLTELSISKNRLKYIHQNAFNGLINLKKLNLDKNFLFSLPQITLAYSKLEFLSVKENKDLIYFTSAEQFNSLKELRVNYAYHCCAFKKKFANLQYQNNDLEIIKANTDYTEEFKSLINNNELIISAKPIVNENDCSDSEKFSKISHFKYLCQNNSKKGNYKENKFKCSPEPDPFTPCENLLEDLWLRISVWLISSLGILSNLSVVAYNIMFSVFYYYNNNDINVSNFLLTNLASADSLMSIYLLFIAIKDSTSRHTFGQSALVWQRSFSCNLAGFLSVVSSVASALSLSFITFERYYAIRNSIDYNKRISIKSALIGTIVIWIISISIASLPLFDLNSYSAYAICLPFDTRDKFYKLYVIGLNSLLVFCFFFIFICYILLFIGTILEQRRTQMTSCNNESQNRIRMAEDQKLARNITMLVIVNMICWGPVVYTCIRSIITMSPMNRAHLKILAIFVVPFNSLINPFLYCITRKGFRMYIKTKILRYKIKKNFTFSNISYLSHLQSNGSSRSSQ